MKNTKPNAEQAWKDFEDLLAPQLNFSVIDRAVYSHLSGTAASKASPASVFRCPGLPAVFVSLRRPHASRYAA